MTRVQTANDPRPMLQVSDVAHRLSVSEAAVYRALREGRLPGVKLLGCWRVDPGELEGWIDSARVVPVARVQEPSEHEELKAQVLQLRSRTACTATS